MNLPQFPQVNLPVIPERDFCIESFGAVKGGTVYNTKAINAAIEAAHDAGGGRVVVPDGIWLTGAVTLKSRVNLHLMKGALVKFGYDNREEFPLIITNWEGGGRIRAVSPINADNAEDIAISGEGIIDGCGEWWRPRKRMKYTERQWKGFVESGGYLRGDGNMWYPSKEGFDGESAKLDVNAPGSLDEAQRYYRHYRPVMVSLVKCNRVLLEGVTFQNSPAWNVHPLFCEHITIRNAEIRNPWHSQNGDGLDLESCKYALIENVRFDVGDDAICMKAGKNAEGRKIPIPTEYVTIRDCVVYHGHGGFVVGSEMSRGVRNIKVSDCTFIGTDTGIRFKSALGRGGVVEDIYMENINMTDIAGEAIIFTMGYGINQVLTAEQATSEDVPEFRNMYVKNVTCVGAGIGLKIEGLENKPIHGLTFENVAVTSKRGITVKAAENIKFINSKFTNENDAAQAAEFADYTVNEDYATEF
jgi:polygalacturonase